MDDLSTIRIRLKESLTEKRYRHTEGVAYTAAALAMKYGEDIRKAEIAGLLHDCAKCMDNDTKIRICLEAGETISSSEEKNPYLLHAKAGAITAKNEYGIEDEDILNSIRSHTTGRPGMSLLEKIVYIADYIEPRRSSAPNLSIIRRLSFEDIDQALIMILSDTLIHLKEANKDIDPMTQYTYEYYHVSKES